MPGREQAKEQVAPAEPGLGEVAAPAAPGAERQADAATARQPGSAPPRIVVHYRRDAGPESARRVAAALQARGYARTELRPVSFAIARANVRFFHDQNRPVARAVNDLVEATGRRSELRDFTHYAPLPSAGTVEIWLPG